MKNYVLSSFFSLLVCIALFSCKSQQQTVDLSNAYAEAGAENVNQTRSIDRRERVPVTNISDEAPPFAQKEIVRQEAVETKVEPIAQIATTAPVELEKVRDEVFTLDTEEENVTVIEMKYHVVVGSFRSRNNAKSLQETLNKEGNEAVIVVNEHNMYRVLISSYNEYMDARERINQLSSRFPDAWVLVQKEDN